MNVAARYVRQAMVKEIAERGQRAIEASTCPVDDRRSYAQWAALYLRAAGANVATDKRVDEVIDVGYECQFESARALAAGSFVAVAHIRSVVACT